MEPTHVAITVSVPTHASRSLVHVKKDITWKTTTVFQTVMKTNAKLVTMTATLMQAASTNATDTNAYAITTGMETAKSVATRINVTPITAAVVTMQHAKTNVSVTNAFASMDTTKTRTTNVFQSVMKTNAKLATMIAMPMPTASMNALATNVSAKRISTETAKTAATRINATKIHVA
jgi:hypothetical protein